MGILSMMGPASAAEITEGMEAPEFEARDQHGALVRLADYRGKSNVVLYFYPKDNTPGCTAEACGLRDGFAAIQATGAVILGVSADTAESHRAFAEKYHLPFSSRIGIEPGRNSGLDSSIYKRSRRWCSSTTPRGR